MKTSRPFLLVVAAVQMALTLLTVSKTLAENVPNWTFHVPPPTFTSNSSVVDLAVSDSQGNSLHSISHFGIYNGSFSPGVGVQVFLLSPKGKILASGELAPTAGTNKRVQPITISAKKVVLFINSTANRATIDKSDINNPKFVFAPLALQASGSSEQVVFPVDRGDFDRKFLHTFVYDDLKVGDVRCYTLSKMQP